MPTPESTDAAVASRAPARCGAPIDPGKRRAIKLAAGTTALSCAFSAVGVNAAAAPHQRNAQPAAAAPLAHHITINIQINRPDLDDWVLIENLTEHPLILREFAPRFCHYSNKVLDLNALLSRQQRGKQQLEIWPNHGWTHSTTGATRSQHPLRPNGADTWLCERIDSCRSLQLQAHVQASGQVILLG